MDAADRDSSGRYTASSASGTVVPLSPGNINAPTDTFYWVYPGNGLSVQYNTVLVSTSVDPCISPTFQSATATFNVAGPVGGTITVLQVGSVGIQQLNGQPNLQFGTVFASNPGVLFSPSATPPSGSTNNFVWVQLLSQDILNINGTSCNFLPDAGPDLDSTYPAAPVPGTDEFGDSPPIGLLPADTKVSREFNAQTYLLWNSGITNAISVPVGAVLWSFSAAATNSGSQSNPSWTASGTGSAGAFVPSSNAPPTYGYPTWKNVTNTTQCH